MKSTTQYCNHFDVSICFTRSMIKLGKQKDLDRARGQLVYSKCNIQPKTGQNEPRTPGRLYSITSGLFTKAWAKKKKKMPTLQRGRYNLSSSTYLGTFMTAVIPQVSRNLTLQQRNNCMMHIRCIMQSFLILCVCVLCAQQLNCFYGIWKFETFDGHDHWLSNNKKKNVKHVHVEGLESFIKRKRGHKKWRNELTFLSK